MTASVARFIESFILKITIFSWTLIVLKKTFTGNVAITGEAIDNHISLHQKTLPLIQFSWIMNP